MQLKEYEAPSINLLKLDTEGCLLDFSTQIPVVNKPADKTDVLSKQHFEFNLWSDDEDMQDEDI